MMEADFNPRVLLHRLDVEKMLIIKEAFVDHRPCADLHDPKPPHIKEEQEEVCSSLGGEQLNWKEFDAIRFPVTATPIKSEDDKQSPLISQLYQDQLKGRELPEENVGGEESIRIQHHEDGFIFSETEDTEMEEEDNGVKHPVSVLKQLSNSGLKTKDMDNNWKESRAPKSDGNNNNPFSSSEFAEQFGHRHSLQKHMMDSELGTSSSTEDRKLFIEKKKLSPGRGGVRAEQKCHSPTWRPLSMWISEGNQIGEAPCANDSLLASRHDSSTWIQKLLRSHATKLSNNLLFEYPVFLHIKGVVSPN
ncbi:uncharacterized protein LOC124868100 isoform X2 [Girardinichthys multiradiatus]|uniref:uncharacterized protein LOC124868100 isoform X2 n=1 Tax=Girardinichthys multiradiatus TaxID=208333 RepID=UPI001FAD8AF8|nr:uncharacterized protein LOC124868100 isoform X2 [Girardinichthys multiradiatus]